MRELGETNHPVLTDLKLDRRGYTIQDKIERQRCE